MDVLLLGGPTACGKTAAALALARAFDAEIVGADSRQIYRDMPIGTAAPTPEQLATVPHHLVGIVDPYERYSAARFALDAIRAIQEIRARAKRTIVAGGTGFYLRALAGEVALAPQYDRGLRQRLAIEARVHPAGVLHAWLASRDPVRAAALHPEDTYRVLRALEVALASGVAPDRDGALPTLASQGIGFAYAVLDVPLDELDARIERRVDAMLAAGFVDEAERIGAQAVASNAVGYPLALAWARGWSTAGELRRLLARATRRYARRQRAWFRGERTARRVRADALEAFARETLGWR
ncbi:MAG TPA: tRNA (adenosine(37)-N6)-dimethylallyltransferase MiaA [Candidatus Dormibacteraeota bacterium]|nr:tRNA (adenosine(37)-N6)-dimethylallyltransferase MiaA [Candidatus Dormibacteraeota bacterium]